MLVDQNNVPGLLPESRDAIRQTERLPSGYKPLSMGGMTFDPRLCFELALKLEPPAEIFERYGYDESGALDLAKNPVFQRALKVYADDIADNGVSFRMKARVAAEDLLTHAYEIATDPEAPSAVRADLIKWHAKVADYEPKQNVPQAGQGNGFQLQIVFSGEAKKEPLTIEGERIENE